tara:strand:- start:7 stop:363 length:357 start_codon:yes stop_codon:yes gene_type:complete
MSYDRLNWSYPIPEKDISKKERYRRLESIYQLSLPLEITKQLVLLFKYDLLKKKYKQNYRKVLFELKKRFKTLLLSKRIRVPSPLPVPSSPEKQVAFQIYPPLPFVCLPATKPFALET